MLGLMKRILITNRAVALFRTVAELIYQNKVNAASRYKSSNLRPTNNWAHHYLIPCLTLQRGASPLIANDGRMHQGEAPARSEGAVAR
jgi:hypothetical protein